MRFNQRVDISALNGGSLKLVDKFTYLRNSILSTENGINTRLENAWTAINWLSVEWKLVLSDKIKRNFFQAVVMSILLYGCTPLTLTKVNREKTSQELYKDAKSYIEQLLEATSHKTAAARLPTSHLKNWTKKTWWGHCLSKGELISDVVPLHTDKCWTTS